MLEALEAAASGRARPELGKDDNPFTGLAAFQEDDAGRFFGRDRDIVSLVAEVRRRPLVALVAPSGAGKSSLVRAGLQPALKRSGEGWQASILRPGRRPLDTLAGLLAQMKRPESIGDGDGIEREPLIQRLRDEPGHFGARLRFRLHPSHRGSGRDEDRRRLVLFVDQFEELYTLSPDPDERRAFVALSRFSKGTVAPCPMRQ